MAAFYSNSDVYVSATEIEIKGERFSPLQYNFALVSKVTSGFGEMAGGAALVISGGYLMFSVGWTIFGLIVAFFGAWLGYNGYQAFNGNVDTIVTMQFQTTRTGSGTGAQVILRNYAEGEKLKKALEQAYKAALDALSLDELKELAE